MRWHQKETGKIAEGLISSIQGISFEEAKKRLEKYGPNELREKKKKNPS